MRLLLTMVLLSQIVLNPAIPTAGDRIGVNNERAPKQQTGSEAQSPLPNISIGGCTGCFQSGDGKTNEQQSPYDARSDRLYRWYLRTAIGGAIGGFFVIVVLIIQSCLLCRGTRATERTVETMMNAERAMLLVDGQVRLNDGTKWRPSFSYDLVNAGKTPAVLVEAQGELQIGDATSPTPPSSAIYAKRNIPYPLLLPVVIRSGQCREQRGQSLGIIPTDKTKGIFETQEFCFWACGFFIYLDVFGREYEQRYCYRHMRLDSVDYFFPSGPAEYNQAFIRPTRTYYSDYRPKGLGKIEAN